MTTLVALVQVIIIYVDANINRQIAVAINVVLNVPLFAFYSIISFKGKTMTKVVFALIFYNASALIAIIVQSTFILLSKGSISKEVLLAISTIRTYEPIISKAIMLLEVYLIILIKNDTNSNLKRKWLIATIPIISLATIYIITNFQSGINGFYKFFVFVIYTLLVTNTMLMIVHELVMKEVNLKYRYNKYIQQVESKKKHNKEIEKLAENARKLNHDVKNHFITLGELSKKGSLIEIENYLNEVVSEIVEREVANSGNSAIDAILNTKNIEIEELKIDFKFKIDLPITIPISNSDLSVLIGNILDNAIEANKNVDEDCRYIKLYISFSERYLVITCLNSNSTKLIKLKNGLYKTTKNDKINHGFGLKSIQYICDKYGGRLNLDNKDGEFTTKCILFVI